MLPIISFTLGLAILSGLNLYLATFLTSLSVQQGWINPALHPAVAALGHPAVLIISLGLVLTEFIMDKVPWVDSMWDVIHTIVRPVGAVLLGWMLLHTAGITSVGVTVFIAALSGVLALGTHLTKSGVRLVINASPEPFTNILASFAEDVVVASLMLLLINAPLTGFAACLVLLVGTWIVLPRLVRLVNTSLVLLWKKLTGSGLITTSHFSVRLPNLLTAGQISFLTSHPEMGGASMAAPQSWALPCVTGRIRGGPGGLRANFTGTLISPSDQPGMLLFMFRRWFRWTMVRLSLAGAVVHRETTMLSENLVIQQKGDDTQVTFRFSRADGALVACVVDDLRNRLGLDAPVPLPNSHRAMADQETRIWTAAAPLQEK